MLITYVLQSVTVDWFYLLHFSVGVISSIGTIIFNFLWRGKSLDVNFHLARCESLSKHKDMGDGG